MRVGLFFSSLAILPVCVILIVFLAKNVSIWCHSLFFKPVLLETRFHQNTALRPSLPLCLTITPPPLSWDRHGKATLYGHPTASPRPPPARPAASTTTGWTRGRHGEGGESSGATDV